VLRSIIYFLTGIYTSPLETAYHSKSIYSTICCYKILVLTSGYSGGVKYVVRTLKIDSLPVLIYLDKTDLFNVAFFDDKGNRDSLDSTIGLSIKEINSNDVANGSSWYDNVHDKRIVWGLYKISEISKITVNGRSVKYAKISFTAHSKKYVKGFWYVVLKGKSKYVITKTK
jgi:hypothetical protein